MKTTFLTACAVLVMLSTASVQARENEKTPTKIVKTIETSALRGVRASAGFDVTLTQAAISGAVISVSSSLQPYLHVEIEDGVLVLGFDNIPNALLNKLRKTNLLRKAEITVTSLDKLRASSGAQIKSVGAIVSSDDCEVRASSGSQIKVADLTAHEISVDVSSGASASISGTANKLDAEVSSGSSANLSKLKATSVNVRASSGASVKCLVVESLTSKASSGGSVRYSVAHNGEISTNISNSSGGSCRKVNF